MIGLPEITTTPALLALWAGLGYALGSVPFGLVMARLFGLGDLRKIGSGNIGATNVLRTGNKLAAALTLLGDAGKAGLAVLLARVFAGEDAAQLAGLMAFAGHCYPVWLGFRGGKGVATFLGMMLALNPVLGAALCATWLAIAGVVRISSASALGAVALSPLWAWGLGQPQLAGLALALAALVFWTHRANIARIWAGTEPKVGRK